MSGPNIIGRSFAPDTVSGTRDWIRVALVSGSVLFRAGLAKLLEGEGVSVLQEANSLLEVLPLLENDPPDIIILDFDPQVDGLARLDCLDSAFHTSRIIALSQRTRTAEHTRLIESGAVGLVFKSDPPEVLIKAIRKVYAGEVWLDRTSTAALLGRMSQNRRQKAVETQRMQSLTKRESEIIALVGEGLNNGAIGKRLFISESTVRHHLTSVFAKLNVVDRLGLAVYAFKHGLVRYGD